MEGLPFENSIITEALGSLLTADPELTPGLNSICAICGSSDASLLCKGCKAICYCSKACMAKDRVNFDVDVAADDGSDFEDGSDEPPAGLGHTKAVCSALSTVVADDIAEENDDATDNNTSELESFAATLSNMLLSHPSYETLVQQGGSTNEKNRRVLQVHIIGAEEGSEVTDAFEEMYGDALDDLCGQFSLDVELVFVGPGLASLKAANKLAKPLKLSSNIKAYLVPRNYEDFMTETGAVTATEFVRSTPDLVVFFNPGFTCQDYSWSDALKVIPEGTPFIAATNTFMEGLGDGDWLHDNKFIAKPIEEVSESDNVPAFVGPNPWSGTRVRQSGVFANDLYVKNSVVLGGVLVGGGKNTKKKKRSEGGGGGEEKAKKGKKNKGLV
jgi:hypothetical protein